MKRYKISIEYDGTNYHGWQLQNNTKTVQGAIEKGLRELNSGKRVVLHGAGRTDSGVHALAQVAHFDLDSKLKPVTIKNALNAKTPRDIIIHKCQEVNPDFHSRFDAKKRYYFYKIYNGKTALMRNYLWPVDFVLNREVLQKCANMIVGSHDFGGFCLSSDEANHKICQIYKSTWKIRKKTLIYKICGNRFLHSMVRLLTGTMIEISRGRYELNDFQKILENRKNSSDPFKAPARGLYLEKIEY
jgi:tRNA pseudouridine38-40 synthase